MNAIELVTSLNKKHSVMKNISEFLFGFQATSDKAVEAELSMEEFGNEMEKDVQDRD